MRLIFMICVFLSGCTGAVSLENKDLKGEMLTEDIVGYYEGEIWHGVSVPSEITFNIDKNKNLVGKFKINSSWNDDESVKGEIKSCIKKGGNLLKCRWSNNYYVEGDVEFIFYLDKFSSHFEGFWMSDGMDRYYPWNGVKRDAKKDFTIESMLKICDFIKEQDNVPMKCYYYFDKNDFIISFDFYNERYFDEHYKKIHDNFIDKICSLTNRTLTNTFVTFNLDEKEIYKTYSCRHYRYLD